ncbi:hypothetical protein AHAS_Ahas06G0154300 [Arachis hypogaea]
MKPPLITLIKNNCSYNGNPSEDPQQHISTFLKTCNAVKTDGSDHDTYKILLFPFSLKGEAAQWFETFPQGSITSWDDLVTKFLAKFTSSRQIIQLKKEEHLFTQRDEEPLFKAWERYKKANDKVGFRAFYEGLTPETRKAVDYFSDGLLKATTNAQGITDFNNKGVHNQHPSEKPQNAIPEKEVASIEEVNAFKDQNKQMHHQPQQNMELSAAVNAKFPPWRPHSYLRMREPQHQEHGSFHQDNSMTTTNQHLPTTNTTQSQYSQHRHSQTHLNWRRSEYQNHRPREFHYNNPNFINHQKHHHSNNNHYMPPPHPPFLPSTCHNQPTSQDSQRITNLEILMERMMKHQEETTRNQEMLMRGIEEQIVQLAKYFAEMGEKKPDTFFKTIEDKPTNNKDATKKEGWKGIIEDNKKILDKGSTSQGKHNKEFFQEEAEDRTKEKQKILTGKFALGDRVMINIQPLKVSPQLSDHYTVTKILPQECIEVIKEETGRKFTVKTDKLRHCDFRPP